MSTSVPYEHEQLGPSLGPSAQYLAGEYAHAQQSPALSPGLSLVRAGQYAQPVSMGQSQQQPIQQQPPQLFCSFLCLPSSA
eukprot:CAMPEP_0179908794 /NCGR_PEP_ID=MMETSP0982-20121206/44830_1 /TAXON_ID=483367 /ORGANISM="non described non described, Strain CCMP 2436" /LENGTH=80 /DNA_ID=CAMNT_0021810117 /DNA_START=15 /DNA_END=253 /DNA_ORIENTATION=-